jgi:hypothetical protein
MRTVRGVLAGTWFLLVAGSPTASAQQPADPLAAVLAQFPDNGLPALIADFERACQSPPAPHDPLVFQRLAQLGPAAHEALLGCALSSYGEDRGLASAFGDFDARAAWALPLLLEESNLTKPLTQELLVQLGPAAMPALPTLQALAQGQHKYLKTAIERIAKASDQPVPLAVARPQPHVDAQQIPALLERLRNGPEEQRWPALQALLLAGDAAAASAAEVILTLELDVRTLQTSQDLAAALRCTYGARCLQGRQPQEGLLESELPAELLRLSLAGRLDRLQSVQSWFQSTNAAVRRDLVLGLLLATNPQMHFGMLPTQDDEATVRQRIDLLQRVRRTRGARTVEELLPALVAAPSTAEREELLKDLRSLDLRDAPAALWPIVFECATKLPRAQQTASSLLYTIARQQAGLPDAVLRLLPQLGSGQDHAQLRRELLNATNAEAIVAYVRTVSERPDDLAVWLTILNAANRERGSQIVALLGSSLAAEIALLPATGKLAWLELDRSADVDDAIWQELLTDPDPASRLKAIRAARWRDRTHPLPLDLLLICLRDEDLSVATITSYMVGADQRDPQRVTRAIAARFDTASDDLRFHLLLALRQQREQLAAVRSLIDSAFANASWRLQLPAALLLLDVEPEHGPAFAALVRLQAHSDPEARQQALRQVANTPALAARCVDRAIECLKDPNDQVQTAAIRLLGAVPAAKERTLPLLRQLRERRPNDMAGQVAAHAIETLERPPTTSPDKR